MSLDGLSSHTPSLISEANNGLSTIQEDRAKAIVEEGGIHEHLPALLLKFKIRGATQRALKGGRSEISAPAPTTREKLFAALTHIHGITLAEAE